MNIALKLFTVALQIVVICFSALPIACAQPIGVEQTFYWTASQSIASGVCVNSPLWSISIPYRHVTIQFFQVAAKVTNRGPGRFAFAVYGWFQAPGQNPGTIGWGPWIGPVDTSWEGSVTVTVDYLAQTFRLDGAPLSTENSIPPYFRNTIYVDSGDLFLTFLQVCGQGASKATAWIDDTSIHVKGTASGEAVPEFGGVTGVMLSISLLVTFVAMRKRKPFHQ